MILMSSSQDELQVSELQYFVSLPGLALASLLLGNE